jgi:uncharacterized membrane protein
MMKMNKGVIALSFLPALITLFVYRYLPERIPMHWGISGEIDRWGSRTGVWLFPAIIIFLALIIQLAPKIDPRKENYKKFDKIYHILCYTIVLVFTVIYLATLVLAFAPDSFRIEMIIKLVFGILFIMLGNFMPKIKHNYFIGMRMPWTLDDEEVWNKTHRMAGWFWFLGGAAIIAGAFIHGILGAVLFFVIIALMVIVPAIYSYLVSRKIKQNK